MQKKRRPRPSFSNFLRLLWVTCAALLGSCGGLDIPAGVEVIPFTCDRGAECGAGTCRMVEGEALCECAPGDARTHPHLCETLIQGTACHGPRCDGVRGCTSPAHCLEGELCERLTGRCLPREPSLCAERAPAQDGLRGEGGSCFFREAEAGSVQGCYPPGVEDRCRPGLACVPTGPLGYSLVCGAPENALGICRRTCSLCPEGGAVPDPSCGEGSGCFYLAGYGGVCVPLGYAEGECGQGACRPGESCVLGGTLRGFANGRCAVPCAEGDRCPEPGQVCAPGHERMPDQRFCQPPSP